MIYDCYHAPAFGNGYVLYAILVHFPYRSREINFDLVIPILVGFLKLNPLAVPLNSCFSRIKGLF